ncbi:MAG: HNH endonuclease, partial [Nocardiopsaceae bacterium]|nr:HNH endonuclease [Nocardiopsaceae bacterium]
PLATWLGLSESPGEACGHGALDAADARSLAAALAARPGNRWCITLTDARGRPVAHGCVRAGRAGLARGSDRPKPPVGTGTWSATVTITPLAGGRCDHARETRAYQLPPTLRHLIETRQATCCFPGCRRPAVRCDKDHTIPYDQGGKTCVCNCAPLCRRHHAAKQAGRWHLAQPQPGTMIWTTPSGRTYTTGPTRYPR